MTEPEFADFLKIGHESEGVEFKGPGQRTDSAFLAGVIRAILGMANRRDGGHVIIGIKSSDPLEVTGLDEGLARAWQNYDELATRVNEYASPSVRLDVEILTLPSADLEESLRDIAIIRSDVEALDFVIIRVYEFDDIPILCSKDFHISKRGTKETPILRRGACYVRARHKPETSEIPSEEEMRELLELAIDKGVRKFVTRAQRAGLLPILPVHPSDESLLERQSEEMG